MHSYLNFQDFLVFYQDIKRRETKKFGLFYKLWNRRVMNKNFVNMLGAEWEVDGAW